MSGGFDRSEDPKTLVFDGFDISVTSDEISDFLNQAGEVTETLTHTNVWTVSGFVTYNTIEEAKTAFKSLNGKLCKGKPIEFKNSDSYTNLTMGTSKVYFKNFDVSINEESLRSVFKVFGTLISFKLITDNKGQSKGYGFMEYEKEEEAQNAISELNGILINGKEARVCRYVSKREREEKEKERLSRTVFVKNLSESCDELYPIFIQYGYVIHAGFVLDENYIPKGCGLVVFKTREEAAYAIEELNGSVHDGKMWIVEWALSKSELYAERKANFEQEKARKFIYSRRCNLYVKNLDISINDEKLKELFSKFGRITSSKVMVNSEGLSKGHGFVAFSTPDDAARAVIEMNGKMIGRKPLYVAFAEQKDERKARLEEHFAHTQALGKDAVQALNPGVPPPQFFVYQGSPSSPPGPLAWCDVERQLSLGYQPGMGRKYTPPYLLREQGQTTGPRNRLPLQQLQLDQRMNEDRATVPHAPVSISQQIAQPRRYPTIAT